MWRQTIALVSKQKHNYFPKRNFASIDKIDDDRVHCLMLHPVTWPNHGAQIELYLAEEAIGLVKSLNWSVQQGPMWEEEVEVQKEEKKEEAPEGEEGHEDPLDIYMSEDENGQYKPISMRKRKKPGYQELSHRKNISLFKREKIREGDFVYAPEMQGVYFKKGGLILEFDEDDTQADLYDEWKNELIRESVAKKSLIKVRKVHSGTYFPKGKLHDLGYFLKENEDVNVVYINAQLTSLQQKKLEKRWNDIILSREDQLRKYNLKSAQKQKHNPTDVDSDTQVSDYEGRENQMERRIRVIDRFGIILQIFAQRAKSRAAQLQIELAWLKYARTMLVRGGAPTFGQIGNIFKGNLMRQEVTQMEIKSARGRKSGAMGGEGETQLEIERRRLTDRETKISTELKEILKKTEHDKQKKEQSHQTLPLIALIGYTNAGKTALINMCTGSSLESQDLLFQTLNTSHKRFRMPSGQTGIMLDTVGFITNLPHGLVESFKSTLEEIHFADLIVHVRDISHPQTKYQRDTVLKVMKEIGIPDDIFESKYIEVWNKIDLLKDQDTFISELQNELSQMQQPKYPVVLMSCTEETNKDVFLNQIDKLSRSKLNKDSVKLTYPYSEHHKVTKWLSQHAGLSTFEDLKFDEESQKIELYVPIDEVIHQKFIKQFQSEQFEEKRQIYKKSKLTPPPGWSSKA